jgi:hypothetical protein
MIPKQSLDAPAPGRSFRVPGSGSAVVCDWHLVADYEYLVEGERYDILTDTDAALHIGLVRAHIQGPTFLVTCTFSDFYLWSFSLITLHLVPK